MKRLPKATLMRVLINSDDDLRMITLFPTYGQLMDMTSRPTDGLSKAITAFILARKEGASGIAGRYNGVMIQIDICR